VAEKMILK